MTRSTTSPANTDSAQLFVGWRPPSTVDAGDYVLGDLDPLAGSARSSVISASPWYFTVSPRGELLQGPNVFALARQAGLAWCWNTTAISQIALIGHTIGMHTLHPQVFRMPPDSRVSLNGGHLRIDTFNSLAKVEWGAHDLDERLCYLPNAFMQCLDAATKPILSLSGGYDSRVLLSLCRAFAITPSLVTMGSSKASDVKIAKLLAERLGGSVDQVVLNADDYLSFGERISYCTSGVKTAGDWHTWLYNRQITDPTRIHLVGSNGEFARTFFSDAITRSRIFRSSGKRGTGCWLVAKATNRMFKYPRVLRRAGFMRPAAVFRELSVLPRAYPRRALDCLDVFYACERVHHFIGSGLACYAEFSLPRSPFLHRQWIEAVAGLKRSWKEENGYHRAVVERYAPEVSNIPYNRDPDGGKTEPYSPFDTLASDRNVADLLVESSYLDHIIDRSGRIKAIQSTRHRRDTVSFLLTMHFAGINAARCLPSSP